jgi:hypothetical protein
MSKDLLNIIGGPLRDHAKLVAAGIPVNQATRIITNEDLSFTSVKKPMTLTDTYREQLCVIAQSVDVNLNALLGMLTPEQAQQAVTNHEQVLWLHPEESTGVHLSGLTQAKGVWWMEFEFADDGLPAGSYQLHDLMILDVLGFMDAIGGVLGV